jgi:hypothetical protein
VLDCRRRSAVFARRQPAKPHLPLPHQVQAFHHDSGELGVAYDLQHSPHLAGVPARLQHHFVAPQYLPLGALVHHILETPPPDAHDLR